MPRIKDIVITPDMLNKIAEIDQFIGEENNNFYDIPTDWYNEFNNLLAILLRNLNEVNNDHAPNKKMCDEFNSFCIQSTRLERAYNVACDNVVSALNLIKENTFLIEKNLTLVNLVLHANKTETDKERSFKFPSTEFKTKQS